MIGFSTLLQDLCPDPANSRSAVKTPEWVRDVLDGPDGVHILARTKLDSANIEEQPIDIATVTAVAGDLACRPRASARMLAQDHGISAVKLQRVVRALRSHPRLRWLGRSWAPSPTQNLARVPGWGNRQRWLIAVQVELESVRGRSLRREFEVSRHMVLRVARTDAEVADGRTGRGVFTAHKTVAKRLRCSVGSVRHARAVLERLGLAVTVVRGRYLRRDEREQARSVHGGTQWRTASVRWLTLDRRQAMISCHLPRSGSVSTQPSVIKNSPRRAGKVSRRSSARLPKLALCWQRLAAQVVRLVPHLGETHLGNLGRALSRTGIDASRWSGAKLVRLVNWANGRRGFVQPLTTRSPIGLFLHQVQVGLQLLEETNSVP